MHQKFHYDRRHQPMYVRVGDKVLLRLQGVITNSQRSANSTKFHLLKFADFTLTSVGHGDPFVAAAPLVAPGAKAPHPPLVPLQAPAQMMPLPPPLPPRLPPLSPESPTNYLVGQRHCVLNTRPIQWAFGNPDSLTVSWKHYRQESFIYIDQNTIIWSVIAQREVKTLRL